MGTYIGSVDGVSYYTDRVVSGQVQISANVGYIEFSSTYDVYSRNWSDSSGLKSAFIKGKGSIQFGVDHKGNPRASGSYGLVDVAVVKSKDGELSVFTGVSLGKLAGVGISVSGKGGYPDNLSTYNTIRVNADGSYAKTIFSPSKGGKNNPGVVATITEFDKFGNEVNKYFTSIPPSLAWRLSSGLERHMWDEECFPAGTPVLTYSGLSIAVEKVGAGERLLSFDPQTAKGRGDLVPKRVSRTFTNITEEWLRLTWAENGEEKELVTTPGHHFLDRFGKFPQIERMIADGVGTIILADGSEATVTAERIVYSAETADMFEQAEGWVMRSSRIRVLKSRRLRQTRRCLRRLERQNHVLAPALRRRDPTLSVEAKRWLFARQVLFDGEVSRSRARQTLWRRGRREACYRRTLPRQTIREERVTVCGVSFDGSLR